VIGLADVAIEAGGFRVGPVDLTLGDGEYGVLLGPSGAGKSLVLEAVAGVRRMAAGAILVDGQDVTALAPEQRRVGLVFQDGLLFPHLSVAGNVAYGLRRAGVAGRAARAAEVERLAAAVGATELLARKPATLSGGERQRVAVARALAARPRALLLDEPLSAVDAESREGLQDVLRRVSHEQGLSVLHVTHDRAEASALADTCAVLVGGRLLQTGPPRQILMAPADEAVARFVGARNVLHGLRDAADERLVRLPAGAEVRVARALPAGAADLVVRPEDVKLWREHQAPAGAEGVLAGRVVGLSLQGGFALVRVEAPDALDALIPARGADDLGLALGVTVDVGVPPGAVHVLPPG
jgi:ABC-type Fe3+/spermidine/putrescine transport system ATPase subunit